MPDNKTSFGFPSLVKQTPMWAKVAFAICTTLTTVATFVISSDPAIHDATKIRIALYLKAFDMLIFGISKLFGMNPQNESN